MFPSLTWLPPTKTKSHALFNFSKKVSEGTLSGSIRTANDFLLSIANFLKICSNLFFNGLRFVEKHVQKKHFSC